MSVPSKLIFLPGAGGTPEFWRPVSDVLNIAASRRLFGWPGFGSIPADENVNGIEDLVSMVVSEIDQPSALIAQSMGGVVAIKAALRKPELVANLVLVATSGGVNMSDLIAEDWRPSFLRANPLLPRWFIDYTEDLSEQIGSIHAPTLLLWGGSDRISPIAVGTRLCNSLPNARLRIVEAGEHDLAFRLAHIVAPLIAEHLKVTV